MNKKIIGKPTPLTKLCKLSELGLCKIRFKPKVFWQEFCKTEHQERYWKIIKKEKRATIRMFRGYEKRITKLEERIEKLEEKYARNGRI